MRKAGSLFILDAIVLFDLTPMRNEVNSEVYSLRACTYFYLFLDRIERTGMGWHIDQHFVIHD